MATPSAGPLLNISAPRGFLMMERAVASSDATNIETSIRREGDEYVINDRKWWSSGVGDPRCKIAIVMGKTATSASRHLLQSHLPCARAELEARLSADVVVVPDRVNAGAARAGSRTSSWRWSP